MPIPAALTDLSSTISLNSPQGSESAKGTIDDYLRSHAGLIKQLYDATVGPSVTLASAATVAIGFAGSANITITGTTNITAFDTAPEGTLRYITFTGALTIVHNATSMALPGAQNLGTSSADAALFKSLGGGNWKCMFYMRSNGAGPVFASTSRDGSLSATDWNTFNSKQAANVCLPTAGGTMSGSITFNNFVGMFLKDTGGTPRQFLYMDNGNFVNLVNAGATSFRILNQAITKELWRIDEDGFTYQSGRRIFAPSAANGTVRIAFELRQANGTARQQFALDSDESPSIFTYDTNGVYSGSLKFNNGGIAATGPITAPTVTETSDERKKKRWQHVPKDLIERLAGIHKSGLFKWKKGGAGGIGVGAQSLEAILPEAVHTDKLGNKSVQYGATSMVISIELARKFVAMEARIAQLEAAK